MYKALASYAGAPMKDLLRRNLCYKTSDTQIITYRQHNKSIKLNWVPKEVALILQLGCNVREAIWPVVFPVASWECNPEYSECLISRQ